MTTAEILAELDRARCNPSHVKPSDELLAGLVQWDGGCGSVGKEWEPVRSPAYRITPAGRFALEAWKLAPP